MFEKRIHELKTKTEKKFLELDENSDETIYYVALNESVREKTKTDLIGGLIFFVIALCLSVPFIYYFGPFGGILAYISVIYIIYLLFVEDHIKSKIENPYISESLKVKPAATKKDKK